MSNEFAVGELASESAPGRFPRDWDAASYDRVSAPQREWAVEVIDRLELRGDEVVLDAGCGSGRVTLDLLQRLPGGRVIAVDLAPSMVEHARSALPSDRAIVLLQDLLELNTPEPVDAIFSNATFHWIHDHETLFALLFGALKPGGRLSAQCGGAGNIDAFRAAAESVTREEPFDYYFATWPRPWNYATAEDTATRLKAAGFIDVEAWLRPWPVQPPERRAFAETVCLGRHLDPLPEGLRGPFVDRVMSRVPDPLTLDYVRLNMTARRP
jgi:trans-aconitate 2-methyltransferase